MSTTAGTIHNTNKACCSIPPVQSSYSPRGTTTSYGGFDKVYVTGPDQSENGIVVVYDIFGFFPQTQQGADMVAKALNTRVYMPDFFEPNEPFPASKYPPQTPENKAAIQAFFGGPAKPDVATEKLKKFAQVLKQDGAKKVGAYGFCWGGKVAISAGGEGTPLDAVAMVHPALLSVADAEKLTVPLAIYISKDESVEEYKKILDVISKNPFASNNDAKHYTSMFHGWAAARANLENEDNRKEFDDVYKKLVTFFEKNLA